MTTSNTDAVEVDIEGRLVRLTNLDKVLWPATGMTKAWLIDHYRRLAPVLLPYLRNRPITLRRFPDGVDGPSWFETRAPAHPPWVRVQRMHTFRSGKEVDAPIVDDLASLVWAANAAAIELHPFLAPAPELAHPSVVVFDLDPGEPATLPDACRVALRIKERLDAMGLVSVAKSSGAKGVHAYVPVAGHTYDETKGFARRIAVELTRETPDLVVDVMTKAKRAGKVFVDWSQNDAGKSTIAPYSVRGLWYPTASLPVTWDEVARCGESGDPGSLMFLASDTFTRLDRLGDLFAVTLDGGQRLPDPPAR